MPTVSGLVERVKKLRPRIQPAYIVYLRPNGSPVDVVDDGIKIHEITHADDPLLERICAPWQLPRARAELAKGNWDIIVALKDDEPVGRIWETFATERALRSGIPRVRLAKDECLMFDLFVDREYRRSNVAMTMAHHFFEKYDPAAHPDVRYVYGFISYENGPSVLWHHAIGFNIAQTINYLSIGERIKWRMPFSDVPRFGPMSRKGRHTDPSVELFGNQLMPQ